MLTGRRNFLRLLTTAIGLPAPAGSLFAKRRREIKNWVWIPTDIRKPADDWKRRFALMRASGVRAILPEVYAGREAFFGSVRLPVKTDWLGMLLPLARAEGLEVHAWMWCMPCMIPEIMKQHPDWYNVNAKGESALDKPAYVPHYKFLDPGRPEVREWIQGTVRELAGIAELTGIHLDYIRHPDAILPRGLWKRYNIVQDRIYPQYDYGYSEYERRQFRQKYGADPLGMEGDKLRNKWLKFRLEMVTGLVNGYLAPAARAKGKVITAAVFPGPAIARANVMQDWGRWKLDAFLPMLYQSFYEAGPQWVGEQTREGVASVRKPVYSGLFVPGMDVPIFVQTVEAALQAGASGVSIFSDRGMDEAKWKALAGTTAAK
jgi:uncharacterized lipoprotein YddW (UPF0748 family)